MALDLGTPPAKTNLGPRCQVGVWLSEHPADADELRTALTSSWRASDLSDALKVHGVDLAPHTLNRHRAGRCKCVERGLA